MMVQQCNLSMICILQCNLNPKNLQTWFEHPISKTKIYVFLDPMLKLIRNTFGDYKNIINKNKRNISYKIQENEGFHMSNKVRI